MKRTKQYSVEGDIAVNDNYYTSFSVAKVLFDKRRHSLRTLKENRKGSPNEVIFEVEKRRNCRKRI